MEFTDIAKRLQDAFGEAILEVRAEGAGDPFIRIAPAPARDIALHLRDDQHLRFDYLMCLSGLDPGKELLAVVYHLSSMTLKHRITIRVEVPVSDPKVPSVAGVWPSANWHEREAWDMFGIVFEGHPELRRILLAEDYPGHPLRKDFKVPEFYNGMKVPY